MMVCERLGKSEEEVAHWKLSDIVRWVAYFKLKSEAEARAIDNARRGNRAGAPTNVTIE
jgi:hypothetical protein